VSDAYPVPAWQARAGVCDRVGGPASGRGVPDVSGDADPVTGYRLWVDGQQIVLGGTSAAAPLWSALVCRLAQALGRSLGLMQPVLYGSTTAGVPTTGFRNITQGDNGAYQAGPGWDACTGLGVPDGTALLGVYQAAASSGGTTSGTPGTTSGTPTGTSTGTPTS
jgi:kumamolisin